MVFSAALKGFPRSGPRGMGMRSLMGLKADWPNVLQRVVAICNNTNNHYLLGYISASWL